MDRTVAHLNIEYFRKLLAKEMAETKLQTKSAWVPCKLMTVARRDVQAEQSITRAVRLIGHPEMQRVSVPDGSWNLAQ